MLGNLRTRVILTIVAILSLAVIAACGGSATEEPTAAPTTPPEPTAAPTTASTVEEAPAASGDPTATPYAFAARSEILEELDERYPWPPMEPPWPPQRGGVAHLTMSPIPDLDPNRARNNENLAQYDALLEWESTWWFPEVHTTPTIRPNIVISWEAVDPSTWDFKIDPDARFHDIAPMERKGSHR